jgi:hypothetical protein
LAQLANIETQLSQLNELPQLVVAECALQELGTDLGERARSLRVFDTSRLEQEMPNYKSAASQELASMLKRIAKRGRLLASWYQRLRDQECAILSFEELGALETRVKDQQRKLSGARKVTDEKRKGVEVPCKVYMGKPLLVELPDKLTGSISAEELASAQVIAPYDQAQEARANKVNKLLRCYKRVLDKVTLEIEEARGLESREQSSYGQRASGMRPILGGIIVQLRTVACSEEKLPDAQTGQRLPDAQGWVAEKWDEQLRELKEKLGKATDKLADATMDAWRVRISPFLTDAKSLTKGTIASIAVDGLLTEATKLGEAARSLADHKERFNSLNEDKTKKEEKRRHYRIGVIVLDGYLDKLRFSDEDIDALTRRFVDFVRDGKRFFDFNFEFQLDEKGNIVLSREGIEGAIQPGGGESQILGLLEMLAVATEFGFPIIIDEVENYLDLGNLRKVLSFISSETEVQMLVTSRDQALPGRLSEWGIDHTAYQVSKDGDGWTKVLRMQPSKQ